MLAALAFDPMWTELNAWVVFGCAVFLAGIALRGFAIYTLGKNYSHRVRHPQEKSSGDSNSETSWPGAERLCLNRLGLDGLSTASAMSRLLGAHAG